MERSADVEQRAKRIVAEELQLDLNASRTPQFLVFKRWFCTNPFLELLRGLLHQAKRKAFLIVDRHREHRSRKVRTWNPAVSYKVRRN